MRGGEAGGAQRRRGEPRHTIFRPWWDDAWKRVGHSDEELRLLFAALLNTVEKGWLSVRTLQLLYERASAARGAEGDEALLLDFIDGDVVDLYRSIAVACTRLIPEAPGRDAAADPFDVLADAELFTRYLRLLSLAVAAAEVPAELAERIAETAHMLRGWLPEMTALLVEVEERVVRGEEGEGGEAKAEDGA